MSGGRDSFYPQYETDDEETQPSDSQMSSLLTWEEFDKDTVPKEELLLCECRRRDGSLEYYSGTFHTTGNGGLMGIVGGHFHFDRNVVRYTSIERLLPRKS